MKHTDQTPEQNVRERFDKIVVKMIGSVLGCTKGRLNREEQDFLRAHPLLLARIGDAGFIKKRYLAGIASFSLLLMASAKIVEHTHILAAWPVWNDLLGNVVFSIATEMFGAALMAGIMELMLENRMRKNRRLAEMLARQDDAAE